MTKKLVDATILLRCPSDRKRDWSSLRDALLKLDGITEAYMTETRLRGVKYSVGGTIVTTSDRIQKLRREIQNLKTKDNKAIDIDKMAMIVEVE